MKRIKQIGINVDIIRIILALLVVFIHASKVDNHFTFYMVHGVARVAVPLFFLLTGMNLEVEKVSEWGYVKHYIRKQADIFSPWIAIYVFVALYSFVHSYNILYGASLFIQFWFVIATWVAVILMHILLKRFSIKQILLISFGLHVFGILGDGYIGITEHIPLISTFYEKFLMIVPKTRSGVFFGLFYICLGMYLKKEKLWLKLTNTTIGILIGMMLVLQYIEINILRLSETKHYNMYFTLIPLALLIMCYIKNNESMEKSRVDYKKMSVQIYITHTLVIFIVASYDNRFFTNRVFLPVIILYIGFYTAIMLFRYIITQMKAMFSDMYYIKELGKMPYIAMLIIGVGILGYSVFIIPRSSQLCSELLITGIILITIATSYLIAFKVRYRQAIYQGVVSVALVAVFSIIDLVTIQYFQIEPILITENIRLMCATFLGHL